MGDWVLCVWVGHFNGRGMPGLFASETAAPLLWQTVNRLKLAREPPADESRPPDVVQVPVCAVSGDLAGKHCPHCRDGWFIGGVSPITSCKVHQKVGRHRGGSLVRRSSGAVSQSRLPAVASSPLPDDRSTTRIRPPRSARPQRSSARSPPSPTTSRPTPPQQNRLLLEANAAPGTRQIHWFADRRYLGASPPAEPLPWQPIVGDYELQAMDDAGRVSTARISVRLAMGKQ